jgi:hypothetical protein
MKYMLFTYRDPTVELDADQRASIPAAVESWCTEASADAPDASVGIG